MTANAVNNKVKGEISSARLSEYQISPYVFGNFVEAGFGRQVSGMWSEMIYNRSFELPSDIIEFGDMEATVDWWMFPKEMYNSNAPFWHSGYEECDWEVTDPELMTLSRIIGAESYKGFGSLQMTKPNDKRAGIRQKGIYLEAGRTYDFRLLAGIRQSYPKLTKSLPGFTPLETEEIQMPFEMILREEADPGHILFQKSFPMIASQFTVTCQVPDLGFTGRAIIELSYEWKGNMCLSCCSLMPSDNIHGWRKDVVRLLKEMKVPVIRYPGGCYASFYNWRQYVGPQDLRPTSYSYYWGGFDDNDASIDEFLLLCDEVGCEPQICVNMMSSTPFKAAEFVEYLNGPDDSPMGRFRQENGVKRTRKVRLFEMDNEAGRKWSPLQYARYVVEFGKAMKAVDPDIELMLMTYSFSNSSYYIDQQLEIAGEYVDYVISRNGDPRSVSRILGIVRAYNEKNGTHIKLVNTEWLSPRASPEPFDDPEIPQFHTWRPETINNYKGALSFRQIRWFYALNGASRLMDYMSYGGEYYLANFNNCVNTWGQNVIESAKEGAWLSPMGEVFKFFTTRDELYPLVTDMKDDMNATVTQQTTVYNAAATEMSFPLIVNQRSQNDLVKLTACETANGINVYFTNKSMKDVDLTLIVPKGYKIDSIEYIYAPDRLSRTYLDFSDIVFESRTLKSASKITVNPLSLNRIVFVKK
ncbi:MAG: hypothetical protein ACOX5T_01275 [Candidatus Cryptobacteroides sp.]|jgi:hypothetical protein